MKKLKLAEKSGFASIVILASMLVVAVSLPIATKLVQQNQENRSNAATKCTCSNGAYGDAMNCSKNKGKWNCVTGTTKNPICTEVNYSQWSACTDGNQTRKIISKTPSNCTGTTALTRTCTAASDNAINNSAVTTCSSYTLGEWSICTGGNQTRSVVGVPADCVGGITKPVTNRSCTNGVCGENTEYTCIQGTPVLGTDTDDFYKWSCDSTPCQLSKIKNCSLAQCSGCGDAYSCSKTGCQWYDNKCISLTSSAECGISNKKTFASAPTEGLCSSGSNLIQKVSGPSITGKYSWTCSSYLSPGEYVKGCFAYASSYDNVCSLSHCGGCVDNQGCSNVNCKWDETKKICQFPNEQEMAQKSCSSTDGSMCINNNLYTCQPDVSGNSLKWQHIKSCECDSTGTACVSKQDGKCGSAKGRSFPSTPTVGLCGVGAPSEVFTVRSNYNWICYGIDGGNEEACTATNMDAVNGSCGTNRSCDHGDFKWDDQYGDDGIYNWHCAGLNGGTTQECTYYKETNGKCGGANNGSFSSTPSDNLCSKGVVSWVEKTGISGFFRWICNGNTGVDPCSAEKSSLTNGKCDDRSNGHSFYTFPTSNLCSAGELSITNNNGTNGYFNWTCNGVNKGTTDYCAAKKLAANENNLDIKISPSSTDRSGDGVTNSLDYSIVKNAISTNDLVGDVNSDGVVNGLDIVAVKGAI